jgi:hypothetical protein
MSCQVKGRTPRATLKKNSSGSSNTSCSAPKYRSTRGSSEGNALESHPLPRPAEKEVDPTTLTETLRLDLEGQDVIEGVDHDILWDIEHLDHTIDGGATFTQGMSSTCTQYAQYNQSECD